MFKKSNLWGNFSTVHALVLGSFVLGLSVLASSSKVIAKTDVPDTQFHDLDTGSGSDFSIKDLADLQRLAVADNLVATTSKTIANVLQPQTIQFGEAKLNQFVADSAPTEEQPGNRWTSGRPDGHAPIGVMGDHTHGTDEFMVSYRYMRMEMAGNLDGTDSLSTAEVLQQFPVSPTRMTGEMHMFGGMYAPTDELTLMVMMPYISKSMDHQTRMGRKFTTYASGLGDISVTGLYKFFDQNRHRMHFNAGMSFPSGSTDQRDDTPAGKEQVLPYPMQLGSGTFDLQPGLTYLGQSKDWSWGGQVLGKIRLGRNRHDYRLGNEINATAWGARRWNDLVSSSLRFSAKNWGDISGADSRLNPALIPTANPDLRGGTRLDLGIGLNISVPEGQLRGGRFGIEFALPVYQSLDGPQLETDWILTAGLQYAF